MKLFNDQNDELQVLKNLILIDYLVLDKQMDFKDDGLNFIIAHQIHHQARFHILERK